VDFALPIRRSAGYYACAVLFTHMTPRPPESAVQIYHVPPKTGATAVTEVSGTVLADAAYSGKSKERILLTASFAFKQAQSSEVSMNPESSPSVPCDEVVT
jgi:hypothetical protein